MDTKNHGPRKICITGVQFCFFSSPQNRMKESDNFFRVANGMLFASNVDVVARAFVTPYDTSHSWCIYIPRFPNTNHPFAWLNIPFRSMDPYGIQAINPPKEWWKVREWIPPKCRTPKTEGVQLPGPFKPPWQVFVIPKIVGSVTELITIPKKGHQSRKLPFAFEFFENLGWFVKCQMAPRISESQVS